MLEEAQLQMVLQEVREQTRHDEECHVHWRYNHPALVCTCKDRDAHVEAEIARRWAASIEAAIDPYASDEGMCTHEMGDRAEERDEQRKAAGRGAALAAARKAQQ